MKRGSGLAAILTKSPTKTAASTTGPSTPAKTTPSTSGLSFSPSQDPPQLTPGKSPPMKKTRKSRVRTNLSQKLEAKVDVSNFEHLCQICLTKGSDSNTLWVNCSGGCGRWLHHKCTGMQ